MWLIAGWWGGMPPVAAKALLLEFALLVIHFRGAIVNIKDIFLGRLWGESLECMA